MNTPLDFSIDQRRLMHAGRGPSFWLPVNLSGLKLPRPLEWIEDLYVNWELGFTSGPQVKLWSYSAPIDALRYPTSKNEEVLLVSPRFSEPNTRPHNWFTRGGCAGLYLPTLDFISVIHKFQPSLLFANVTIDGIRSTEPYAKAWGKPKSVMSAAERQKWGL